MRGKSPNSLTLSVALKSGRLSDFIAQEEARLWIIATIVIDGHLCGIHKISWITGCCSFFPFGMFAFTSPLKIVPASVSAIPN